MALWLVMPARSISSMIGSTLTANCLVWIISSTKSRPGNPVQIVVGGRLLTAALDAPCRLSTARRSHVALVELCGNGVVACNARPLDLLNDRQHVDRKLPRLDYFKHQITPRQSGADRRWGTTFNCGARRALPSKPMREASSGASAPVGRARLTVSLLTPIGVAVRNSRLAKASSPAES